MRIVTVISQKEEDLQTYSQIHLKRVGIWNGGREQEIAFRNDGYSVEHGSLSAHPSGERGPCFPQGNSWDDSSGSHFLCTYYVPSTLQGTQVWLQNFYSEAHLLTIFIWNLRKSRHLKINSTQLSFQREQPHSPLGKMYYMATQSCGVKSIP